MQGHADNAPPVPFPLQELTNGLKTDRGLLSLAVALIHNLCLSSSPPPRERGFGGRGEAKNESGQEDEGQQRLGRLVADRAFCCLLMKVKVAYLSMWLFPVSWRRPRAKRKIVGIVSTCFSPKFVVVCVLPPTRLFTVRLTSRLLFLGPVFWKVVVPQSLGGGGDETTGTAAAGCAGADADPSAEWLYLLFCRFVQERSCRDVYDNVGIRAGGRRRRPSSLRQSGTEAAALSPEKGSAEGHCEEGEAAVLFDGSARVASGDGGGEESGKQRRQEEDEDFFFPVTPEQLIALNLAEIAAGKMEATAYFCASSLFLWRARGGEFGPSPQKGAHHLRSTFSTAVPRYTPSASKNDGMPSSKAHPPPFFCLAWRRLGLVQCRRSQGTIQMVSRQCKAMRDLMAPLPHALPFPPRAPVGPVRQATRS